MPKKADQLSASEGMNQGIQVLSYLIAGVLFYGGLGWFGDHFLKTNFLLPLGIVLGAAGSIYLIIRRFGGVGADPAPSSEAAKDDRANPTAPAAGEEERWDR